MAKAENENLWPEQIDSLNEEMPLTVMKTQAHLLGNRFSNIIEGEVLTGTRQTDDFIHRFYINIPAIKYSYLLFTAVHGIPTFPVQVYRGEAPDILSVQFGSLAERIAECNNSDEFKEALRRLFNEPETTRIVQSLAAQANALSARPRVRL